MNSQAVLPLQDRLETVEPYDPGPASKAAHTDYADFRNDAQSRAYCANRFGSRPLKRLIGLTAIHYRIFQSLNSRIINRAVATLAKAALIEFHRFQRGSKYELLFGLFHS